MGRDERCGEFMLWCWFWSSYPHPKAKQFGFPDQIDSEREDDKEQSESQPETGTVSEQCER